MKLSRLKEIINEELVLMLEASISRNFVKAVEALKEIQLKQQTLRKKFVSEKNPKKKEKFKKDLIKIQKLVQKAESDFNRALQTEPIEEEFDQMEKKL